MKKVILFLTVIFFSCTAEERVEKQKNILVIGNSITECLEIPLKGWYGNWGMAASSPDKDFCALLGEKTGSTIHKLPLRGWEGNTGTDLDTYIFPTTVSYDYIVIKIGENSDPSNIEYRQKFKEMVEYFQQFGSEIIVVSMVWPEYAFTEEGVPYITESRIDKAMREICQEKDLKFVDISEMQKDRSYYAYDEYADAQVACHPNDKGMQFIADKICENIR